MKNHYWHVLIFSIIIIFSSVIDISAQIQFSIDSKTNRIKVEPDSILLKPGSQIQFSTKDTVKYIAIIDNYDHFLDIPDTFKIFYVVKDTPVTLTIGNPLNRNTVKYYSVGVSSKLDEIPPLPPMAPPKIVLKKTE